jgi:FkbM family methyltransferase
LKNILLRATKRIEHTFGLDIQQSRNTLREVRAKALRELGCDVVVDVGANAGQYATEIREAGYVGRIVSYEPTAVAFARLRAAASKDKNWRTRNVALGRAPGTKDILITGNSVSSSFLSISSTVASWHPLLVQNAKEAASIATMDEEWERTIQPAKRVFMKIDTQGFELEVLLGAECSLSKIDAIECELSLVPVYDGQPLFFSVASFLYDRGFIAIWLQRGFQSPDGDMLQFDALFRRAKLATTA